MTLEEDVIEVFGEDNVANSRALSPVLMNQDLDDLANAKTSSFDRVSITEFIQDNGIANLYDIKPHRYNIVKKLGLPATTKLSDIARIFVEQGFLSKELPEGEELVQLTADYYINPTIVGESQVFENVKRYLNTKLQWKTLYDVKSIRSLASALSLDGVNKSTIAKALVEYGLISSELPPGMPIVITNNDFYVCSEIVGEEQVKKNIQIYIDTYLKWETTDDVKRNRLLSRVLKLDFRDTKKLVQELCKQGYLPYKKGSRQITLNAESGNNNHVNNDISDFDRIRPFVEEFAQEVSKQYSKFVEPEDITQTAYEITLNYLHTHSGNTNKSALRNSAKEHLKKRLPKILEEDVERFSYQAQLYDETVQCVDTPYSIVARKERLEIIHDILENLKITNAQLDAICKRFGLFDGKEWKYQEITKSSSYSSCDRARQNILEGLKEVRKPYNLKKFAVHRYI